MQSSVVDALSDKMPGIKFFKMDVDQNLETAQKFWIMSTPTLMAKKDGKVIDQTIGYHSEDQLK